MTSNEGVIPMNSYKTKAVMENLDSMIDFVVDNVKKLSGNDTKLEGKIRLVCEEAFVNVINYAYPDSDGEIEIQYNENSEEKKFSITMLDSGVEFDPLKKEDPDITLAMEEREIGGLGIFMIKQIMDNVVYERKNGQNVLFMEKTIK